MRKISMILVVLTMGIACSQKSKEKEAQLTPIETKVDSISMEQAKTDLKRKPACCQSNIPSRF